MGIEVSIIMNSYNKYPQNLLSLYALENQTFDLSKIEVIFVDDASTDETPLLKNYTPPYTFKYIRCEENVGRSKAKNMGIYASQGDILIILDAEMLVDPDFVKQHYDNHQSEDMLVITGCTNHHGIYTVVDCDMTKTELTKFAQLAKRNFNKLPRKTREMLNRSILKSLNRFQYRNQQKFAIFSKNDIWNLKYKLLSFSDSDWSSEIVRTFGNDLNGFYGPWMFVITRNISVRRSLFDAVGPFYEEFAGWGYEDWEFGYRIHKYGGEILEDSNISVYHQEHAKIPSNIYKEERANYLKFYTRHTSFEVGIFSLKYIDYMYGFNLFNINNLVQEFNILKREYLKESENFRSCYLQLFKQILKLSLAEKPVSQLVQASGISSEQLASILSEKDFIKSVGKYQNLIRNFEFLLSK
ncbi:glycosyltransferase [Bacillus cereus]|uniref:glycosyltransferase family 2 protein n=1 Tax=Bacillus cereus TaxID=1396 RepID=UPI00356F5DD6